MSRIWSALPQRNPLERPPLQGRECWWRLRLEHNEAVDAAMIFRVDDIDNPRIASWEFFDGNEAQLVVGVEIAEVRTFRRGATPYLDILTVDRPTPAAGWFTITGPGEFRHPDTSPVMPAWDADIPVRT